MKDRVASEATLASIAEALTEEIRKPFLCRNRRLSTACRSSATSCEQNRLERAVACQHQDHVPAVQWIGRGEHQGFGFRRVILTRDAEQAARRFETELVLPMRQERGIALRAADENDVVRAQLFLGHFEILADGTALSSDGKKCFCSSSAA